MARWSKVEDELLITLRNAGVPYKNKVKHFEGRTQDALRNRMERLRNMGRANDEKDTIVGVLDIETSNFKADIGWMISWAIYYPHEERTVWDVIKKRHITNYTTDKQICKSLLKELDNVELLITYYGTGFDIPFIRTRCLDHGLDFPEYGRNRHRDCYYMAKGKVATHRKSLKAISELLGIEGKTPVPIRTWRLAMLGHPESLEYVLEHNLADVEVTWKTYEALRKFAKYTQKSI